jgi:hypothetical protein
MYSPLLSSKIVVNDIGKIFTEKNGLGHKEALDFLNVVAEYIEHVEGCLPVFVGPVCDNDPKIRESAATLVNCLVNRSDEKAEEFRGYFVELIFKTQLSTSKLTTVESTLGWKFPPVPATTEIPTRAPTPCSSSCAPSVRSNSRSQSRTRSKTGKQQQQLLSSSVSAMPKIKVIDSPVSGQCTLDSIVALIASPDWQKRQKGLDELVSAAGADTIHDLSVVEALVKLFSTETKKKLLLNALEALTVLGRMARPDSTAKPVKKLLAEVVLPKLNSPGFFLSYL